MLRVEHDNPVDAILLLGDNFYPCGIHGLDDPQWSKITEHFGPVGVPIFPVLGNHDYGDPQAQNGEQTTCGPTDPDAELEKEKDIPEWHFPARSYLLHSSLADFIMLDTQPIASGFTAPFRGSATAIEEIDFLRSQLDASKTPWRFVVGHHTIYSSGMHGRTNDSYRANMRTLLPMLDERLTGADAYICGHDHDLELIGDPRAIVRPMFLISGSGSGLDEMKPRKGFEPPTIWPAPPRAMMGFAVLDITQAQLTITFYDPKGDVVGGPFAITRRIR
jgi:hypothetical protein